MEHRKTLLRDKNETVMSKNLNDEYQAVTLKLEEAFDGLYSNTELDLPDYSKAHRKVLGELTLTLTRIRTEPRLRA